MAGARKLCLRVSISTSFTSQEPSYPSEGAHVPVPHPTAVAGSARRRATRFAEASGALNSRLEMASKHWCQHWCISLSALAWGLLTLCGNTLRSQSHTEPPLQELRAWHVVVLRTCSTLHPARTDPQWPTRTRAAYDLLPPCGPTHLPSYWPSPQPSRLAPPQLVVA